MRIAIFCPEGNINDNPSIHGIVGLLCERGHDIDLVVGRRPFNQVPPHPNARLHLVDVAFFQSKYLTEPPPFQISKSDLNIGVDADGIRIAAYFSKQNGTPLGMISYEIFFSGEADRFEKEQEIEACSNIEFAVVQDFLRGQLLCLQNRIPTEKLIYVPVGGRGAVRGERHHFLHDQLKIPREQKIAILAGSVCRWSMADRLILSTCDWPPDWTLVLHCRYGIEEIECHVLSLIEQRKAQNRIFISDIQVSRVTDLSKILASVDLGLAFYKPTYESKYVGKNIRYIGLSSGKIATYLQHGVPVACNDIGVIADLVRECDVGIVMGSPEELPRLLKIIGNKERRDNCFDFFERYLDLNRNHRRLLDTIDKVGRSRGG